MALTAAQRTTLAAHIRANTDQAVIDALAIRHDNAIVDLYNADSSFYVWRPTISIEEYRDALDWTEVDNITDKQARVWEWVTGNMTLPLESGKQNVRQGLAQVWAANTDTRSNLLALAKRFATVAEEIYATGNGSQNNPGALVFEGQINSTDVGRALNENP